MIDDTGTNAGRGRPRDPVLDRRITDAARRVFRTRGWLGATMEEIAATADVSKATLYRRYPTKVSVAFDAWVRDRKQRFPNTDTGSVWGDLTAYLLGTAQMAKTGGWGAIIPGVLAEVPTDRSVAEAVDAVWEWRGGIVDEIVGRAKARGEMRPDVAASEVLEMLDGPVMLRLLVTREPLDIAFVDRSIENVMCSVARLPR